MFEEQGMKAKALCVRGKVILLTFLSLLIQLWNMENETWPFPFCSCFTYTFLKYILSKSIYTLFKYITSELNEVPNGEKDSQRSFCL